jgi:hypothetical protein
MRTRKQTNEYYRQLQRNSENSLSLYAKQAKQLEDEILKSYKIVHTLGTAVFFVVISIVILLVCALYN